MRILYGLIPSVPTIPSLISVGPRHCEAHNMAIAMIGAVVRLIGICLGRRRVGGNGMRTGTMTKKMEIMKTTRVAIEYRVIIWG